MSLSQNPAYARVIPFAIYISFLAVDQPLSNIFNIAGLDSRWLYAFKVTLVACSLVLLWGYYEELVWPPALRWQQLLSALVAGVTVFLLWILPYPSWALLSANDTGFNPTHGGDFDIWLVLFRVLGAALVVPVMEELFWRSFIMRWLDKPAFLQLDPAQLTRRALFVSAILFAVEHNLWLAGLIAGLVYGWLYQRYRNLWIPIIAHATTNGLLAAWVLNTGAWQYW